MALAQRRDERVDQRRIAPAGERLHRRPPDLPVVVAHRLVQRSEAVHRLDSREPLDGAHARIGVGRPELPRQLVLAIEPLGDIFDRHDQADVAVSSRSAPMTTRCCMRAKRGDGAAGGHGMKCP